MVNSAFVFRVCQLQFSVGHGVDRIWHGDAEIFVEPETTAGFQHHNGHFAGTYRYYSGALGAKGVIVCLMNETIRILGIDPGLRNTGWGVIDVKGNGLSFVAAGTIKAATDADLANRLLEIFNSLTAVIGEWQPQEAAVEETFVNNNPRSTLKLGQARGTALLAPAKAGMRIGEYAPNQVKKSVIGVGHGDKKQIKMMVGILLPKAKFDSDDAADALAIAICHAHNRQTLAQQMRMAAAQ